ncbi:MAG: hypothetical protein US68_C0036G0004 [Candidatus Shapirobacteria bacterium GW2011_GWE1_38_10]|uniref:YtkA-like domain-containing protein n=1 Tax=Candidatus Shapirobacteria bacterium GW2011_GWE1_38_10 TaxID=1618488 RepID=A0A0G0I191_9BACT|nr:MAG: hypothetical protein US68_C0036G0004 [Candidatus Shapirobacteria bacterium GW2011_GWE1_38_10]
MTNKILLLLLVMMAGALTIMGLKVRSTSVLGASSNNDMQISLSTKPSPLKPGPATFLIEVKDKDGKLIDDASVNYDINMTTMDMGAQSGKAESQGKGQYLAKGTMSMLGPWKVSVAVKMPNGATANKDFTVTVRQ